MNPAAGFGEENLRSALNKAELETLEALKLQYFQNATRFLAKGEYDSALAEIKRVLLIDPEHRLAREYEIRVTELQASRVQAPKTNPAPQRETPRVAPPTIQTAAPPPVRSSRWTWLSIALIVFVLVGTAGVLTLEKVDDQEQPPVATAASIAPQTTTQAEQPVENTVTEPVPPAESPASIEPKHTLAVVEKRTQRPEPVLRDSPVRPAVRRDESPGSARGGAGPVPSGQASPSGAGPLAILAEKKVEPLSVPQPEVKMVASQAPPPEVARESAPFVAVQEDPKIVRLEKPRLPDIVLKNHISGEVTAKVLIDRDGKPQEVQIVSSTSSVFEQPVIDAIGRSSFSPGMMGSGPVAAWMLIPFRFK